MRSTGRIVAGIAAGLAAGLAMNLFARVALRVNGGREAPGAAPGRDRLGRGAQPPQAVSTTDQDGAVKIGSTAYRAVMHRRPNRRRALQLGTLAHYLFSAALGAAYALFSQPMPAVRAGFGTMYGTAVWFGADEAAMPAMRLSKRPDELPTPVLFYALAAHWVFGIALEASLRTLTGR